MNLLTNNGGNTVLENATEVSDELSVPLQGVTKVKIGIAGGDVAVTAVMDEDGPARDAVSGHLQVRVLDGDALQVKLEAGTLVVEYRESLKNKVSALLVHGGTLDALHASAISGEVIVDADPAPTARAKVDTVSGNVAFRLGGGAGADVDFTTMSGSFASDVPIECTVSEKRRMQGRIRDGRSDVVVAAVSGDLSFVGRKDQA